MNAAPPITHPLRNEGRCIVSQLRKMTRRFLDESSSMWRATWRLLENQSSWKNPPGSSNASNRRRSDRDGHDISGRHDWPMKTMQHGRLPQRAVWGIVFGLSRGCSAPVDVAERRRHETAECCADDDRPDARVRDCSSRAICTSCSVCRIDGAEGGVRGVWQGEGRERRDGSRTYAWHANCLELQGGAGVSPAFGRPGALTRFRVQANETVARARRPRHKNRGQDARDTGGFSRCDWTN